MLPDPLARPSAQVVMRFRLEMLGLLLKVKLQELCQNPLLVPSSFPCLLQPSNISGADVNVLSILTDSKLLEVQSFFCRCIEFR
jgi:hypothetical protein